MTESTPDALHLSHLVEFSENVVLEQHGSVTVRLKVDADVVLFRGVVDKLDASLGHRNAYPRRLQVLRGSAVSVRGLNNGHGKLLRACHQQAKRKPKRIRRFT